jgi:hypothetical protein
VRDHPSDLTVPRPWHSPPWAARDAKEDRAGQGWRNEWALLGISRRQFFGGSPKARLHPSGPTGFQGPPGWGGWVSSLRPRERAYRRVLLCHPVARARLGSLREGNGMNDRWLIMMAVLLVIAVAAWGAVVFLALH